MIKKSIVTSMQECPEAYKRKHHDTDRGPGNE